MDFLKKNYEKVILIAVLVGLASASGYLVFKVTQVQDFLRETDEKITGMPPGKVSPVNLVTNEAALNRVIEGADFKPGKEHFIFNPVTWVKLPDGRIIRQAEGGQGPNGLKVTGITNLYFKIAYERADTSSDPIRYQFAFTHEEEKSISKRSRVPYLASQGGPQAGSEKNKFILKEVRGPKEDPESFVLELAEGNRTVTVTKSEPFKEILGHMADMRYDLENKTFNQKRTDDKISFSGDTFTLVIREKDVILTSIRTQKKTTRPGP